MIIVIPSNGDGGLDAIVSDHFGHCDSFTIVKVNKELPVHGQVRNTRLNEAEMDVNVIDNRGHDAEECEHPGHNATHCGDHVSPILKAGATHLLVSGIGGGPVGLLKNAGVKLYNGAFGTVREAIRDFLNGLLDPLLEGTCGHHYTGGCGHHHFE